MQKDHFKTQVAVLLRGQLAHALPGGALYRRTIQDRFWDVKFRVCAGVPNTVNSTMSDVAADSVYPREVTQTRLPLHIEDYLKNWGPKRVRQVRSRQLMECCHELYNIALDRYSGLCEPWRSADHKHLIFPLGGDGIARAMAGDILHNVILDDGDVMDNTSGADAFLNRVRLELLKFHYVLGQIWSMGEAYNSYQELCELNPDWKPDVIWCTRPDAFAWYPDEFWHNIKYTVANTPGIHCSDVHVAGGRPVISDYSFYSSPEEIAHYGNIADNLIDAWTNHPELLIDTLNSGSNLQHQLWSVVFRNTTVVNMQHDLRPIYQGVLRPVEGLDSAVDTACESASRESIATLHDFISAEYSYPKPNTPHTPKLIGDAWDDVMSD